MSFWRRLFGGEDEPEVPEAPEPEIPERAPAPVPSDDPDALLERLGSDPAAFTDDAQVLAAIEALRDRGREARAIDLARRVLFQHPDRLPIHQRVAEMLASRGDDEGAMKLLEPFLDRAEAPLDL